MTSFERLLRDIVPPLMRRWQVPGVAVGLPYRGQRTLVLGPAAVHGTFIGLVRGDGGRVTGLRIAGHADVGPFAWRGGRARHPHRAGGVPIGGRHHDPAAWHRGWGRSPVS